MATVTRDRGESILGSSSHDDGFQPISLWSGAWAAGFQCPRQAGCRVGVPPSLPHPLSGTWQVVFSHARGEDFRKVVGNGRSLSEVKIASLLDEVPVGLRSSHVEVWSVNRFVHREQFLLGHPHLLCLGFQLPLNAETEGVRSAAHHC